eukprot:jgi/Chlat1/5716/Chrsp38S05551
MDAAAEIEEESKQQARKRRRLDTAEGSDNRTVDDATTAAAKGWRELDADCLQGRRASNGCHDVRVQALG